MNTIKQSLLFILFFLFSQNLFAQWVGGGLKFGEPVIQKSLNQKDTEIIFEPNPLNELTLTFVGPQYSFGLQFTAEKEDDGSFLNSGYSDFVISFFSKTFIVDLVYHEFSDLYIRDDQDEIILGSLEDTIFGNSIGVKTLFYLDGSNIQQIHGEHVLDPRSSWGHFYKISVDHSELNSDDELIPVKYQSSFTKLLGVQKVTTDSILGMAGLSGLYAWEQFFINSYLMLGPSFDSQVIEGDFSNESNFLVNPVAEAFLGMAYYDKQLQLGVRAKINQKLSQIRGVDYKDSFGVGYAYLLILF